MVSSKTFISTKKECVSMSELPDFLNDKTFCRKPINEQFKVIKQYIYRKREIERIEEKLNADPEDPVFDSNKVRWLKCSYCGKVAPINDFGSYGGIGRRNQGTCYDCSKKAAEEATRRLEEQKAQNVVAGNACPLCAGKVVKRTGRYGEFWGCSNYPKCHFTAKIKQFN